MRAQEASFVALRRCRFSLLSSDGLQLLLLRRVALPNTVISVVFVVFSCLAPVGQGRGSCCESVVCREGGQHGVCVAGSLRGRD